MKSLPLTIHLLGMLSVICAPAWAGSAVFENMYLSGPAKNLAQGFGSTYESACADAVSAIPSPYRRDPGNSPAMHCTYGPMKNDSCQDANASVVCTIPFVRK